MFVYFNPKSIGHIHTEELLNTFPEVTFITDPKDAYLSDVIAVMPDFFKDQDLNRFDNLKFVQLLMAGYDNFDFSPFEGKDIIVSNAVDIFSTSIAEDVFTKIFVLNRNVKHYLKMMETGTWSPIRKEPELSGSTVGILGTGSIGKETAKRMKSFDTHILGYRTKQEDVEYFDEILTGNDGLEELLKRSDYVIVAIPLNEKTFHLLDKQKLSLMKEEALLINVARGKVIDQDALVELLEEKKIRGAGLDTLTPEPLPSNHPLWTMENVFITPHNASSSPYMQVRLKDLIVKNLNHFIGKTQIEYVVFHKKSAK
ncbi:MAG: D-2-hydroxyacid dehydrogenase [Candidatus Izemoplasmatales bacterium]